MVPLHLPARNVGVPAHGSGRGSRAAVAHRMQARSTVCGALGRVSRALLKRAGRHVLGSLGSRPSGAAAIGAAGSPRVGNPPMYRDGAQPGNEAMGNEAVGPMRYSQVAVKPGWLVFDTQPRGAGKAKPAPGRSSLGRASASGSGVDALDDSAMVCSTTSHRKRNCRLPEASRANRCLPAASPGSSERNQQVPIGWHRGRPGQAHYPAAARNRTRRGQGHKAMLRQVWSSWLIPLLW